MKQVQTGLGFYGDPILRLPTEEGLGSYHGGSKVSLYKVDFSLIGKSESSQELKLFQIFEIKGYRIYRVPKGYNSIYPTKGRILGPRRHAQHARAQPVRGHDVLRRRQLRELEEERAERRRDAPLQGEEGQS